MHILASWTKVISRNLARNHWGEITYRKVRNHEHASVNEVLINCYGFLLLHHRFWIRDVANYSIMNAAANMIFSSLVIHRNPMTFELACALIFHYVTTSLARCDHITWPSHAIIMLNLAHKVIYDGAYIATLIRRVKSSLLYTWHL